MSNLPNQKMPKDAAQLVIWFKQLPQPTAFLTTFDDARAALDDFRKQEDISFFSYPDGRGVRSESTFSHSELRGITIEYPTIQMVRSI